MTKNDFTPILVIILIIGGLWFFMQSPTTQNLRDNLPFIPNLASIVPLEEETIVIAGHTFRYSGHTEERCRTSFECFGSGNSVSTSLINSESNTGFTSGALSSRLELVLEDVDFRNIETFNMVGDFSTIANGIQSASSAVSIQVGSDVSSIQSVSNNEAGEVKRSISNIKVECGEDFCVYSDTINSKTIDKRDWDSNEPVNLVITFNTNSNVGRAKAEGIIFSIESTNLTVETIVECEDISFVALAPSEGMIWVYDTDENGCIIGRHEELIVNLDFDDITDTNLEEELPLAQKIIIQNQTVEKVIVTSPETETFKLTNTQLVGIIVGIGFIIWFI